jgi:pseudouridine synthase
MNAADAPDDRAPGPTPQAGERLQKVLAQAGLGSRRHCEAYILAGRVQVNGRVVTELGRRVHPERDAILVDGRPIAAEPLLYYLLYKPRGYLSTVSDPHGGRLVVQLVPSKARLYPVGRLDRDSEGLLLLTNDGELAQRLAHPRYEHAKEYLVLVRGAIDDAALGRLRQGLLLEEEGVTVRARVRLQRPDWTWRGEPTPSGRQWLRVVLWEGRKRQIRRMFDALGLQVERLIRVRMGDLALGDLQPGSGRWLSTQETSALRAAAGLDR